MKKVLFSLFVFLSFFSSAQNSLVKAWDKRYGGTGDDWLTAFRQTTDGGFILGGYSWSGVSGDKTQPTWIGGDFWVVKTDSLGSYMWDRDYGGIGASYLYAVIQTTDGGYLLGGYTYAGIGGNKTQPCWGFDDYWIVKIDSLGNYQWDKRFGGTMQDRLFSLYQTRDHGFILGGYSFSGISGDKTEANRDPGNSTCDYWIVKTDSLGSYQWDKRFGGTDDDELFSVQQTSDNGYILGGHSFSDLGGDKSQASWNTAYADYWMVKTDSLGTKQWDKRFGGTYWEEFHSLQQTIDGGYFLKGISASGISGDKTQAAWAGLDYWAVKTDSLGNKEWDKDLGGNGMDDMEGIGWQTADGGFVMSGSSSSMQSGDKSEDNISFYDAWIVKTDSLGNKQWDKTVLSTPERKIPAFVLQTREGCYAVAKPTYSGIGGEKTEANWDTSNGSTDYWIIKYCETLLANFTAPDIICPGTCVDFLNLSSNAVSYQWNFAGANPPASSDVNPQGICYSTPGTYDVQLIASNATSSDTLLLANFITVYPQPPPQAITQTGDTLFAIPGATMYQWYYNGNSIASATNYFYVATQSGDYNVVATDTNGCEVEAAIYNVVAEIQPVPIAIGSSFQFAVFPNPVNQELKIRNEELKIGTAATIGIYNVMGELVLHLELQEAAVDVSDLAPGLYSLELSFEEKVFRSMFVKK